MDAIDKLRRRLGGSPAGPSVPPDEGHSEEEESMLRMSFLEHLEELRARIIRCLWGLVIAFGVSLAFSERLWSAVCQPAAAALKALGYEPSLYAVDPMEGFMIIYFKLPLVCCLFIASPWLLYQVWGFVSPGLYKRERRWAVPFILCSAGLFILGGVFAYFVVFRKALRFLLGVGQGNYVKPICTVTHYFDLFVNVILGIGLVFELPILIFFLILLRIVTPAFLLKHSRYAILIIFIIAAAVTPTPDAFNMMLFALPMCLLFYVGIFAGYLLVLHREKRRLPWRRIFLISLCVLILLALGLYFLLPRYGIELVLHWPFFKHWR
ncbi:MAG TPA: twin-arginine translocase subunit TatC [Bryobacteraceae bacterium]|nr:twin-arginine translocase subunit TatC [Bryobacteraceae bacterium]